MNTVNHSPGQSTANEKSKGNIGGLIGILLGIVLGGVVGVFYGQTMWMASGGPERELERLVKTKAQKGEFALAAEERGERDEAKRLRGHIPLVQEKIDQTHKLHQTAIENKNTNGYLVAGLLWEFTDFFGDLFLQVLKLLVIPLVMTSMICGITSLGDIRRVGRVGVWTIVYYTTTGAIAVLIGILLVQAIQPGVGVDDTLAYVTENVQSKEDTGVLETLLNVFRGREEDAGSGMFPSNIFLAASQTNVLALIVFAIVFGGALTTLGPMGQVAIDFFTAANHAVMKMVHLVMYFAPLGIYGLVAGNIT